MGNTCVNHGAACARGHVFVAGGGVLALGASLPFIFFGIALVLRGLPFPIFPESFLHSLGNWVMKAESYIPALCFQRSKCDCQVYKRLFMFSGVKWGASVRSRARERLPCPR